jgi:hypothetical protein
MVVVPYAAARAVVGWSLGVEIGISGVYEADAWERHASRRIVSLAALRGWSDLEEAICWAEEKLRQRLKHSLKIT